MRATNCYMPYWGENGKLTKQGSYCNWESVVAHAVEQQLPHVTRVREYVDNLVGCHVECAPSYNTLSWFHRNDDSVYTNAHEFQKACDKLTQPIVAIRMLPDGTEHEIICSRDQIEARFAAHLTRPFTIQGPVHEPQSFQVIHRKCTKDRDLTIFYWPFKNGLPSNHTATKLFKMQIYGDVVITLQAREPCFVPRERYVNYYLSTFHEQFHSAKKRKEVGAYSTVDYSEIKKEMQLTLQSVEDLASASACAPMELAKASNLPPASGKELAQLARAWQTSGDEALGVAAAPQLLQEE